jgi:hypothetical protein
MKTIFTNSLKGLGLIAATTGSMNLAFGQAFQITNRTYGNAANTPVQAEIDTLFDSLETAVNAELPSFDPDSYLKATANATVASGGGVDADYASPFSYALVGGGVGLAADFTATGGLSDLFQDGGFTSLEGAGAQGGIILGLNTGKFLNQKIGFIDLSRTKAFLSFFAFGYGLNDFDFDFKHFAVSGQYKLVPEKSMGLGVLKWGGVDLTGGLKYNKTTFTITQPGTQTQTASVASGVGQLSANFDGTATVGADVGIFSIPVEVSTSARVLYFLSFFAGMGADFAFGSSSSVSEVTGPISVTDSLGAFSGIGADAGLDLGSAAGPTAFGLRTFGGIQLELYALSVSVQINKSLFNESLGATVGAKLFF